MSTVDNWMILADGITDERPEIPPSILDLNRRLGELSGSPQHAFQRVDHLAGGYKVMEAEVFLLAANHFPEEEVLRAITQTSWGQGAILQVLFKGQHDDHWRQIAGLAPRRPEKLSL